MGPRTLRQNPEPQTPDPRTEPLDPWTELRTPEPRVGPWTSDLGPSHCNLALGAYFRYKRKTKRGHGTLQTCDQNLPK